VNQNPFPEEADSGWSTGVMEKGDCLRTLFLQDFATLHYSNTPQTLEIEK
jgi:hypothetical protein